MSIQRTQIRSPHMELESTTKAGLVLSYLLPIKAIIDSIKGSTKSHPVNAIYSGMFAASSQS